MTTTINPTAIPTPQTKPSEVKPENPGISIVENNKGTKPQTNSTSKETNKATCCK